MSEDRHESLFGGLQQLRQVVERLRLLRLDHTEFACLKALVLFKPGMASQSPMMNRSRITIFLVLSP